MREGASGVDAGADGFEAEGGVEADVEVDVAVEGDDVEGDPDVEGDVDGDVEDAVDVFRPSCWLTSPAASLTPPADCCT